MKWKFVSLMAGFTPIERETFDEAFTDMFKYVDASLKAGNMTYQELETSLWIETPSEGQPPIMFYTARDLACDSGLMAKLKMST